MAVVTWLDVPVTYLGEVVTYGRDTPPDRVLTVGADSRVTTAALEGRGATVGAYGRVRTVAAEPRTDLVPARTLEPV